MLVVTAARSYAKPVSLPDPVFDPRAHLAGLRAGHTRALGIRYVDHGIDWCILGLDYDRRLVSDPSSGILASGPIVSLMDVAAAMAIRMRVGATRPFATLDMRLDYLRPARAGQAMIGRAECYRLTRRVAFARGVAYDGDAADPVAHMTGTFMLLEPGA